MCRIAALFAGCVSSSVDKTVSQVVCPKMFGSLGGGFVGETYHHVSDGALVRVPHGAVDRHPMPDTADRAFLDKTTKSLRLARGAGWYCCLGSCMCDVKMFVVCCCRKYSLKRDFTGLAFCSLLSQVRKSSTQQVRVTVTAGPLGLGLSLAEEGSRCVVKGFRPMPDGQPNPGQASRSIGL